MPQEKKKQSESLFDKFRRAQRFGKSNPDSVKSLQEFGKRELARSKKPKEMKDSRWFKNIKPDINLPLSSPKSLRDRNRK